MGWHGRCKDHHLEMIRRDTGLNMENAGVGQVQEQLAKKAAAVPAADTWRLSYLDRMLQERGEAYYKSQEEEVNRLSGLIDSLCIN